MKQKFFLFFYFLVVLTSLCVDAAEPKTLRFEAEKHSGPVDGWIRDSNSKEKWNLWTTDIDAEKKWSGRYFTGKPERE